MDVSSLQLHHYHESSMYRLLFPYGACSAWPSTHKNNSHYYCNAHLLKSCCGLDKKWFPLLHDDVSGPILCASVIFMFVVVHHDDGVDAMVVHHSPEVNESGVQRGLCDDELVPLPRHATQRSISFTSLTQSRDLLHVRHDS